MSHAPSDALSGRHARLRARLAEERLDALVVTALPNITYLTNFTGSTAIVVATIDRILFLTDSRYTTALADAQRTAWACPGLEPIDVAGAYDTTLARVLRAAGFARVGFEGANVTVSRHRALEARLGESDHPPELLATEGWIERLRLIKDDYEIRALREGGRRLSDAAARILGAARTGMTERALGFLIDATLREVGFSRNAFETIVASGPNAALPHARPTERTISEGDLVVLDFGGVYDSYCVDLTRTVAARSTPPRARSVHDAVRQAHDRAIQAVRPGQSRFAIDAAARDWLSEAGMGDAFGHGTGHGLGIEIHEDPRIVRRRPDIDTRDEFVSPGMVFTIEPGAYFPGWGGVRIEDDVLVTTEGVDVLTDVAAELLEID